MLLLSLLVCFAFEAPAADTYFVQEDFTSASGVLYQGNVGDATLAYHPEGGYYEVDNLKGETGVLATLTDSFSAYELSADVEFYQTNVSADAYAGLVYNYQEDENGKASFYLFAIFPDGYYCVWSVDKDNRRTYVQNLTATPLVNQVGRNTLRVKANASQFEIFLNGQPLAKFRDYAQDHGGVGLFTSGGTKTRFRAFRWNVDEAQYTRKMEQGGAFAFVKEQGLPSVFADDFKTPSWLVGTSGKAAFAYKDSRYVIDNVSGQTMAVSYRTEPVVKAGMVSAVIAGSEGEAGNGYGIAFCFTLQDNQPYYYAFVIARDGTYKLFRNEGGAAQQLTDWVEFPFAVDFNRPQLLGASFVRDDIGMKIFVGLNGQMLDEVIDPNPLDFGGFALIAAPQMLIEVSGVNVFSFEGKEKEALDALTNALKEKE
jgi:hypothetical protein